MCLEYEKEFLLLLNRTYSIYFICYTLMCAYDVSLITLQILAPSSNLSLNPFFATPFFVSSTSLSIFGYLLLRIKVRPDFRFTIFFFYPRQKSHHHRRYLSSQVQDIGTNDAVILYTTKTTFTNFCTSTLLRGLNTKRSDFAYFCCV